MQGPWKCKPDGQSSTRVGKAPAPSVSVSIRILPSSLELNYSETM